MLETDKRHLLGRRGRPVSVILIENCGVHPSVRRPSDKYVPVAAVEAATAPMTKPLFDRRGDWEPAFKLFSYLSHLIEIHSGTKKVFLK